MTRQADEQNSMKKISGGSHVEKTAAIRKYDQDAVYQRMQQLRAEVAQRKAAEAKHSEEMAAVPVDAADTAIVAAELNVSEDVAKRRLQEKKGDLVATLRDAVGLPKVKA